MSDAKKPRNTKRERLAAAFRVRAGAIGLLSCCSCEYPITPAATSTGHTESCQAHAMTMSALIVGMHWHLSWTRSGVLEPTKKNKGAKKP